LVIVTAMENFIHNMQSKEMKLYTGREKEK